MPQKQTYNSYQHFAIRNLCPYRESKIMKEFDTKVSPNCSIYNHAKPIYGMECANWRQTLKKINSDCYIAFADLTARK